MKKRLIIYFDMDGVLVKYPEGKKDGVNFKELKPIPEMVELFHKLSNDDRYEVMIASTAPWSNPKAWEDKRRWVEENIGEDAFKKLILTHRKDLLIGDFLIDDRPDNGAKDFKGEWIQYKEGVTPTKSVLDIILKIIK